MDARAGGATALLGQASGANDGRGEVVTVETHEPTMGDLIVVLLASTLAGLRDRLEQDGFEAAAELVSDLVEIADDYLTRVAA